MKLVQFGVWVWGAVTVTLAVASLLVVVMAGFYIVPYEKTYQLKDAPIWLFGIFYALKENSSLVAGILGFSGLAWSHFFKVTYDVK